MTTVRPICGGANCDRALVVGAAVDGLFPKNEQQQNKRRSTAPTPSPTNPRAAIFGFEIGFTGFFFYRVFVGLVCLFVCFLDRTRFFFTAARKLQRRGRKITKKRQQQQQQQQQQQTKEKRPKFCRVARLEIELRPFWFCLFFFY